MLRERLTQQITRIKRLLGTCTLPECLSGRLSAQQPDSGKPLTATALAYMFHSTSMPIQRMPVAVVAGTTVMCVRVGAARIPSRPQVARFTDSR
jgi:hypothetical protein